MKNGGWGGEKGEYEARKSKTQDNLFLVEESSPLQRLTPDR